MQLSGKMWFPAKITWIPGCFPSSTNSYEVSVSSPRGEPRHSALGEWCHETSAGEGFLHRLMNSAGCLINFPIFPSEQWWGPMQLQSDFPNHITHGRKDERWRCHHQSRMDVNCSATWKHTLCFFLHSEVYVGHCKSTEELPHALSLHLCSRSAKRSFQHSSKGDMRQRWLVGWA